MNLNDFSFSPFDTEKITPGRRYEISKAFVVEWAVRTLVVFAVLAFVLALAIDKLVLVDEAHAEEPVRDNAYYCAHLGDYTNGSDATIREICGV